MENECLSQHLSYSPLTQYVAFKSVILQTYRQESRTDYFPADSPIDVWSVSKHFVYVTFKVVQSWAELKTYLKRI